ncbi:peptidoglycan-binding domain-containing protein [Streptomyces flavidovirens]|uniref:peptidoglycan-binding domain-containing protein n=1 Tax=Streptomyces flavidovirens TaxID=67298 RepID=UPI0033A9CD2E
MSGHICPECGTDRGAASEDGRPGCGCAERAAEAVRAERSAEVAAAEDFNPLRIRPYVTLQGPETDGTPAPPPYAEHERERQPERARQLEDDAAATLVLGVVRGPVGGPGAGSGAGDDVTVAMRAVPQSGPPPGAGPGHGFGPEEPPVPLRKQRTGPGLWLAVGAAAVAVVGTAAFAGGLFSGSEELDRALPDTVTGAPSASDAPEASASESGAGSQSATPSASAAASASASVSASASASVSASASPSRSAGASASVGPGSSKRAAPVISAAPSTAQATGTVEQSPQPAAGAVLSRGDRGPEVAELQNRLAQLRLYAGPENGRFNGRVEEAVRTYQSYRYIQGDPEGTYGPHTRRALEAETREP